MDLTTKQNTIILVTQVLGHYLNTNLNPQTSTGLPFHSKIVTHLTDSNYKGISKNYRLNESDTPPELKTKILELTAIDPNFQPKTFTTTLNKLLIPTKVKT